MTLDPAGPGLRGLRPPDRRPRRITRAILSCPCPDVQRSTRTGCPKHCDVENDSRRHERPSMGFVTLRRSKKQAATNIGLASPDCATPSGFLSLLTLCSARNPSRLVSCEWRPWASAFRGFPCPVARRTSRPPCPPCRFSLRRRNQQADPDFTAPRLRGITHPVSPYRRTRCYPTNADRSSRSLAPLRGFHPSGLGPVLPRNLLSWAFTSRWTNESPISTLALQSFKEPEGRLASFEDCRPP
jgi:hypothetical protein